MRTYNISHTVDYNYWLKRLDTQINEPANQNSIRVTNVVELTNKETLLL